MQAVQISIGNELLNGKTVNSNASFISGRLYDIGIVTEQVLTIHDEAEKITESLSQALAKGDIVIITGGLGPTHDDITKKVIADYFDSELVFDEAIMKKVEERFRSRGLVMPEVNRDQALMPDKARKIDNPVGTAAGIHFEDAGKHIFVLPGVPREMKAMLDGSIIPFLQEIARIGKIDVHLYRTTGITESKLYEKCRDLFAGYRDYEIAFLPKFTGVDIRIAVTEQAEKAAGFREFESAFYKIAGKYIYTKGAKELEAAVGDILREKKMTFAVAESCTGGLIGHKITNVAGSSAYHLGGVLTYSNESKMKFLGVREASLMQHGAVSAEVAREMADGARRNLGADVALATTGIAGPGGGTPEKPVGLLYVGLATPEKAVARKFQLGGSRIINKEQGAQFALELLRRELLGIETKAS